MPHIYKEASSQPFYLHIWPSWHMSHFLTSDRDMGMRNILLSPLIEEGKVQANDKWQLFSLPSASRDNGAQSPSDNVVDTLPLGYGS